MDLVLFWGRFGSSEEIGGELGHMYVKKGGVLNVPRPFWPRKVGPGARQEVPRGPENRPKQPRREVEEAM